MLDKLAAMITDDADAPGISAKYFEHIKHNYLLPADVKKIDIGGGPIHGDAEDFRHDSSSRLLLTHTTRDLTDKERVALRGKLDELLKPEEDSVRFYHTCAACVKKTETIGSEKPAEKNVFIV